MIGIFQISKAQTDYGDVTATAQALKTAARKRPLKTTATAVHLSARAPKGSPQPDFPALVAELRRFEVLLPQDPEPATVFDCGNSRLPHVALDMIYRREPVKRSVPKVRGGSN